MTGRMIGQHSNGSESPLKPALVAGDEPPPSSLADRPLGLTLSALREANLRRALLFHPPGRMTPHDPEAREGVHAWTPQLWAIALAGEVGEVFNARKKAVRGDGSSDDICDELADVFIYGDLFLARIGQEYAEIADGPSGEIDGRMTQTSIDELSGLSIDRLYNELWYSTTEILNLCERDNPQQGALSVLQMQCRCCVLARRLGFRLGQVIVEKFNEVSERRGFDIKLAVAPSISDGVAETTLGVTGEGDGTRGEGKP